MLRWSSYFWWLWHAKLWAKIGFR